MKCHFIWLLLSTFFLTYLYRISENNENLTKIMNYVKCNVLYDRLKSRVADS